MQAEHQATNTAGTVLKIPKHLKFLTGLLIIMFPVGLFIMLSEWGKQFLWTTTLFLALQAFILFILISRLSGIIPAIISALLIIIPSFFVEWWGVNTGFPFGSYLYSEVLQPRLYGVPAAITFAWFSVVGSSFIISKYLSGKKNVTVIITSAVLILASDILLEPFAAFINKYWQWEQNIIPLQNFIAWFFLGILFSGILSVILKFKRELYPTDIYIPIIITGINILNFSVINIAGGYYVLTVIGLLIFLIIGFSAFKFKLNNNED